MNRMDAAKELVGVVETLLSDDIEVSNARRKAAEARRERIRNLVLSAIKKETRMCSWIRCPMCLNYTTFEDEQERQLMRARGVLSLWS